MVNGINSWVKRILLTILCCFPIASHADTNLTSLPPVPLPVTVGIGLFVNSITSIDERFGLVGMEITQTRIWKDPRLAFDPKKEGVQVKYYKNVAAGAFINKIWRTTVEVDNNVGNREDELRSVQLKSDGTITYQQRFHMKIATKMNFRKFPFDTQTFVIKLSPFLHSAREVQFKILPKYLGINKDNLLGEWKNNISVKSNIADEVDPVQKEKFSYYTLTIQLERQPHYYIYQALLLIIIVFSSFSVFWMMPKGHTVNLVAIVITSLVAVIVFHWQIDRSLPSISYLTFMDAFFLWSFFLDSLTIVAILLILHFHYRFSLVRICQIGFPVVYFLGILLIYFLFIGSGG